MLSRLNQARNAIARENLLRNCPTHSFVRLIFNDSPTGPQTKPMLFSEGVNLQACTPDRIDRPMRECVSES